MLITFSLLAQTILGFILPSLVPRRAVVKISTRRSLEDDDFNNRRQQRMTISATTTTPEENPEAMSSIPLVWYLLLECSTGQPFKGTSADAITSLSPDFAVVQFRDAVKAKCSNTLASVDPNTLQVYKNKDAFDGEKAQPLEEDSPIAGLGSSKKEALIVVVPSIAEVKQTQTLADNEESPYNIQNMQLQFYECFKIAESLNMDVQDEIIKTPSELFGTYVSNGILFREEYQNLLDIIKDKRKIGNKFLIIGSPGIGKSVFSILMFVLAIKERKHVAYKPKKCKEIYFFTWNNREYSTTVNAKRGVIYEGFLDGDENCNYFGLNCINPAFLFASPCGSNYNEFKKDGCSMIYMNPWFKEECMKYTQTLNLGGEYERRFNLVGGKPRYLFSQVQSYEKLVSTVIEAIPNDTKALKSCINKVMNNALDDDMKHVLFSHIRSGDYADQSFISFSSLTIEAKMLAKYNTQNVEDIRNLLMTSNKNLQTWRAKMMEQFLLQEITTEPFCIRSLDGNRTEQEFGPLLAFTCTIQSEMEITNELKLYIPISKTFPAIDAVLVIPESRYIFYIQVIVSNYQSIKFEQLHKIYTNLNAKCQEFQQFEHRLLFLVPADVIMTFKSQPFHGIDGKVLKTGNDMKIKQYLGTIRR
jgi:hypothetical protein